MTVRIGEESPLQDDVRDLISGLNAHLQPLSPPEFQFQMTAEQMAEPDIIVFVARDDAGQAVGVGALKKHDARLGEVKRMFTQPRVRGQRIGRALVETILIKAKEVGLSHLVLETGVGDGFEGAHGLYARTGFSKCGAVLDYPDSGHSAFFEQAI